MTRIVWDGFDAYSSTAADQLTPRWDGKNLDPSISSATTRFGLGGSLSCAGNGRYLSRAQAGTHFFLGFALDMNVAAPTGPNMLFAFMDGTTFQCCATIETDKSIKIRRGSYNGTVLATSSTTPATTNVWQWYEFEIVVDPTAGVANVWREGVSVASATGLNTASSGVAQTSQFRLGQADQSAGSFDTVLFDDFYLLDTGGAAPWNTRLGDSRVYLLKPSAAGDLTQLTPDTGSNYQRVQTVDDDSSYVATSTVGDADLYNVDDLPGGFAGTVFGIAHTTRWRKDDAGSRTAAQLVKSGTTTAQGSDVSLLSTYLNDTEFAETDPATSAAFTVTAINALQIGSKLTA